MSIKNPYHGMVAAATSLLLSEIAFAGAARSGAPRDSRMPGMERVPHTAAHTS